jgi:hypothetical protein
MPCSGKPSWQVLPFQRKVLTVKQMMILTLLLGIAAAQSVPIPTSPTFRPDSAREKLLRRFLQQYEGNPTSSDRRTTRYAAAFAELNGDGKDEVIVYLIDATWCGSGGCSASILAPQGAGYRLITRTTITRLPIRVLSTKTDGWHDLGVWVQGGGIQPGYEAKLRFNGTKYPSDPSVSPAQRLHGKAQGKVVIPADAEGIPLYD